MPSYIDIPFLAVGSVKKFEPRHPVYLLQVGTHDYVVIKKELGAKPVDLQHNLKAMKVVSPAAAGKVLCQQELEAIDDLLQTSKYWAEHLQKPEDPDVSSLRQDMQMHGTWFKMAKAEELFHLGKAMESLKDRQDKSGVRAIAEALNRSGGLESLGQIVAIDAYNDNTDRFEPHFPGEERKSSKWLVLVNVDNVIFALGNQLHKPIGLDSYDPASNFRDVNETIEAAERRTDAKWLGRILARDKLEWRKKYAKEIVADLETAMGPRNRKFAMFASQWKRLNSNAPDRIVKGMHSATSALTLKLKGLASKPNCPAGVVSRLKVITG